MQLFILQLRKINQSGVATPPLNKIILKHTSMKSIKGYQRVMGRKWAYCIEFEDCYDIVKRGNGWAATKNGEFIDKYCYGTKFAAASTIPNRQYK